jgi:hypothetical protein
MDDGEKILQGQLRLLKVFMLLDGPSSREYQQALLTSILLWQEWQQVNHPCWQMFLNNASCFNEEVGEISFSVLARGISAGGVRMDVRQVNERFKLLKGKIELADDLKTELGCSDFTPDPSRRHIDPNGAEVTSTVAYFKNLIHQVSRGTYRHYDDRLGHVKGHDARPTIAAEMVPAIFSNSSNKLDALIKKLRDSFNTFWVYTHSADIWPRAIPQTKSSSDDESLPENLEDHSDQSMIDDDQPIVTSRSNGRKRKAAYKANKKTHKRSKLGSAVSVVDCPFDDRFEMVPKENITVNASMVRSYIVMQWNVGWETGYITKWYNEEEDYTCEVRYPKRQYYDHVLDIEKYSTDWQAADVPLGTWFLLRRPQ